MNTIIDWNTVKFGSKSDSELAKDLKVSRVVISRHRRLRNIPAWQHQNKPSKHNWESMGLGTEPDDAIALRTGIFRNAISFERRRRGIPAFSGTYLTQEGLPCRSLPEAMYDAYLHWKDIHHDHEVPILKYRADFKIGEEYHEVIGLMGYRDLDDIEGSRFDYGKKLHRKLKELADNNIKVVTLSVKDVEKFYSGCPLNLKFKTDHNCSKCNLPCNDYLNKGMCNKCYMNTWHQDNSVNLICELCKTKYPSSNSESKYCSLKCYHKSLNCIQWPSYEWFQAKIAAGSTYPDIAQELGIKSGAIAQHISRERARLFRKES